MRGAIDGLVRRKAEATEKDLSIRIPELDRLIAAILAVPETRPQPIDRPEVRAGIDRLFLEILGEPTI